MTSSRILIVEPDPSFGLSLASLYQEEGLTTRVARSAGEAELEIATRRPDLVVLRAELPDLSGFSLCARLRHDRSTERLPVILYSSDTAPGALAEHASTPWAANGYLAMPLDTSALRALSRRILAATEVIESADDAVIEEAEPIGAGAAPSRPPLPSAPAAPAGGGTPPPVPRRAVRSTLTEEDRLLLSRIFASIAERRDALLAEATHRRPPPRRDLLQTADGRMQLLRDDLKAREAQIAQLSELWEIREREVSYAGEWLHEKDVELQGMKGKAEDLLSRLAEARELLAQKEREHAASFDGLLLEKVTQEKELIESIASGERRLHEAERRSEALKRSLEETIAALEAERRSLEGRLEGTGAELATQHERAASLEAVKLSLEDLIGALEAEKRSLEERLGSTAAELAAERERAASLEAALAEARGGAEAAGQEAARCQEELRAEVDERDRILGLARRENERLQGELTSARHEQLVLQSELNAAADRAAAREGELTELLRLAQQERDDARAARSAAPEPGTGESAPEGFAEAAPGGGGAAPADDPPPGGD